MKKTLLLLSALAFSLNTVCTKSPGTTAKTGVFTSLTKKISNGGSSLKNGIYNGSAWIGNKVYNGGASVVNGVKTAGSTVKNKTCDLGTYGWETTKKHPYIAGTAAVVLTAAATYAIYKYVESRKAKTKNITVQPIA